MGALKSINSGFKNTYKISIKTCNCSKCNIKHFLSCHDGRNIGKCHHDHQLNVTNGECFKYTI
jgi:hypothetical protein